MKVVVVGAGEVGMAVVEALHDEHEMAVVDLERKRLRYLESRFDTVVHYGDGTSRRVLRDVGVPEADLFIACTSRDEANIISSLFAQSLSDRLTTVVRVSNAEYLDVWRGHYFEFDHMVSSEEEAAHAVLRTVGLPAAKQTDVFADGQVQIVEFEIEADAEIAGVVGLPLRQATIPDESRVAGIIRGGEQILPRGDEMILRGDRIVVIGSPNAAREWSALMAQRGERVDDIVVYGGGRIGTAVALMLVGHGMRVRILEPSEERARAVSEELPVARVFQTTGLEPDFLERERIGDCEAAVLCMPDDSRNLYAATLVKVHGVSLTIGVLRDSASRSVFERGAIDAVIDPRSVTAEEIVRFAHDPRTRQVAMLEGDRFEVLDVTVRPESKLANQRFRDLPMTGALIGAIVRDGSAIFPHGDDMLLPGDRAIIFTASSRAARVEQEL